MKSVSALSAKPHLDGQRIDLEWRNPPASDFTVVAPLSAIRIVRRQRQFARAVDEARPFRPYFPLGAPDRD